MTRYLPSTHQVCPRCGAQPFQSCKSVNGRRLDGRSQHAARRRMAGVKRTGKSWIAMWS